MYPVRETVVEVEELVCYTCEEALECYRLDRYRLMKDDTYLCKRAEIQIGLTDYRKEGNPVSPDDISKYEIADYKDILNDIVESRDIKELKNIHMMRSFKPKNKEEMKLKIILACRLLEIKQEDIAGFLGISQQGVSKLLNKYYKQYEV